MSPRPGPRRPTITIRMSEAGIGLLDEWAVAETGGNRSEMVRKLVGEAVEARRGKATPGPSRLAWGKGSYGKSKPEGDDHG